MSRSARSGQVVLALISVMCVLVALSVNFVDDPFAHDARVLISSFGVGMGVLALANAVLGLSAGSRSAWVSLWVLPVFFAWHVAALRTVVPDGVLLVVSVLALLATRPKPAVRPEVASPATPAGAGSGTL